MFEEIGKDDFEEVIIINNNAAGLRGFIAIHDTTLGPAFGGIRLWKYKNEDEAFKDALELAISMTYKCAIAGIEGGGGKIVLMDHKNLKREMALKTVARFIDSLKGRFYAGRDVGTTIKDIKLMRKETKYVVDESGDGCGNLSKYTAKGVLQGIKACVSVRLKTESLKGLKFAVQGLGAVGLNLTVLLQKEGGIVTATDIDQKLLKREARKKKFKTINHKRIYEVDCDVFCPCALGGVLNSKTIPKLKCKVVAGSANNALETLADSDRLFKKKIVFAPDYVINSGALIQGANWLLTGRKRHDREIENLYLVIKNIVNLSLTRRKPTYKVANQMAEKKIKKEKVYKNMFWP